MGCTDTPIDSETGTENDANHSSFTGGGKADDFLERNFEVLLTEPFCEVCSEADRAVLQDRSELVSRVVELIDDAEKNIDVAQFIFSDLTIEEALYRADARGVQVRITMDSNQDRSGTPARRLADAGIDIRFISGAQIGSLPGSLPRYGLMHSKFMIVDGQTLLTGSNNWAPTSMSINEESTIVMESNVGDPLITAFDCHFEAAWKSTPQDSTFCSTTNARFSPGVAGRDLIRDEIENARTSVDVLMHRLLYDDLTSELADAVERGVRVRVVLNIEDRNVYTAGHWDRFVDAGGQLRFKQNNRDLHQSMHHKVAIVDGNTLLHGSGNWSDSGFFNNYEFYVRYREHEVVTPFTGLFARLWDWALSSESIDSGINAARQHFGSHQIFFGNLHAHIEQEGEDGKLWDDGELLRSDGVDGDFFDVYHELHDRHPARYAFEYARDRGNLDFMALSPHVVDFRADDAPNHPNMTAEGYADIVRIAHQVTGDSDGEFVAIPSMEWNTNSAGNHVNIFGTETLAKVERGRFDILYEDFLPGRVNDGERPLLQFNHPRTFRQNEESLSGSWDQIYGVNLQEIRSASQRGYKFNDFGLNDYPPLSDVIDSWIAGDAMPSPVVVSETLANIEEITRPYLRLMEVTIGRGTSIAHEDSENPSWVERSGEPMRYTRVESDWHYYLLQGFRLAPAANHDNHYANWGTGHSSRTAIMAPKLTERALLDAVDKRLVYASEDESLAIGFYADNRIPMGSAMETTNNQVGINLFFEAPTHDGPFDVKVFRGRIGGNEVETITHMTDVDESRWYGLTVHLPTEADYFVYVKVHETDAERMAWTAPIWVTRH